MMIKLILQNISNLKSNKNIAFLVLLYIVSLCNINTAFANTGVNSQIPYSGTVVKNDGTVLDGTYRAKLLIYPNASPIVGETALYEEIRNGIQTYSGIVSPSLPINDGKFDILLGSQNTSGISSLNDDSLWLELQLDIDNNGSYEEIFSPRRRIGSALSAINSMRLVANGGVSTNTLSLDVSGNVIATSLGGTVNASTPGGFDRVLLANSSGQFSQVSLSSLTSGNLTTTTGWALAGNSTTDAWNGTTGSRLGTTSAQPLVLATTNATAQDIRFFTGAGGANERMRILGNGNIGIGTTTPQARLDVNGGIRVGNEATNCTSSNIGTLRYNNGGLQVCRAEGWSYLQCPTGYIKVPGNSLYQTKDFCVMKYEAKTGSATVAATTQAAETPTVSISQTNAISACNANNTGGATGYGLINNAEWMTIARNIEGQASNWRNVVIGSTDASPTNGGLYRGHSDNSPANALAANTNDSLGYEGTGNANETPVSRERRTHTLSNGEVIWDLSGNVWEWTDDTILGKDQPTGSSTGFNWRQYGTGLSNSITNFGTLSRDLIGPSNSAWNSTQNMGQIYSDGTSTNNTNFAFIRGGNWVNAAIAGVFTLSLNNAPPNSSSGIGFRCVLR